MLILVSLWQKGKLPFLLKKIIEKFLDGIGYSIDNIEGHLSLIEVLQNSYS